MTDAVTVSIISGFFGLVAIPTGLLLKRRFDLQDRREKDEEHDRRECVRARQAYQLSVEQLRALAQCIVAMGHLRDRGEESAFELGWAQLHERASTLEFDFMAHVDPEAHDEKRALPTTIDE